MYIYICCIPTLNRNVHQSDRDSHSPTVPSTPRYPAPLLYCHRSQQVALLLGLKGEGCTTRQSGCFGNMKYVNITWKSIAQIWNYFVAVQMWDQPFFSRPLRGLIISAKYPKFHHKQCRRTFAVSPIGPIQTTFWCLCVTWHHIISLWTFIRF